ncbi:MAG: hypothetical protein WD069_14985 [Planctomycetales bacterium]
MSHYTLEISDMSGSGLGEEDRCLHTSDTPFPFPIPQIGDCIYFPEGVRDEEGSRAFARVKERTITFIPPDATHAVYGYHVELRCVEEGG